LSQNFDEMHLGGERSWGWCGGGFEFCFFWLRKRMTKEKENSDKECREAGVTAQYFSPRMAKDSCKLNKPRSSDRLNTVRAVVAVVVNLS
jgi:hypothetical protein